MKPTPKITAAVLGGAVSTIIVWVVDVAANLEVPALVGGAIATLCAFGAGYVVKDAE